MPTQCLLVHSGPLSSLAASYFYRASSPPAATPASSFQEHHEMKTPSDAQTITHFRLKSTFPVSKRIHHTTPIKPSLARLQPSVPASPKSQTPNLHPCHICHRRPNTVQDLPAYADCEACGERTCYICMRTCEGPRCHLHRIHNDYVDPGEPVGERRCKKICGKCCVEVGVEGRVWCLVCYEDDADGEDREMERKKKELYSERVERVADWLEGCGREEFG